MPHPAQDERRALADLFLDLGPAAPTLCEGWRTADLAAHLVLRERRPDAAPGIVVPLLAARTERVQRTLRDGRPWPALVATFRDGPPWPVRWGPLDELVNLAELVVHHEDVRRAEPSWAPRQLGGDVERALWRRVRTVALVARRAVRTPLVLAAPGLGTVRVRPGEPAATVTVTAPPSELLLLLFGRQRSARLAYDGPAEAVAAVQAAPFGL